MTDLTDTLADEGFMRLALEQAKLAALAGEVPIGAVLVKNGVVISSGHNNPIGSCDPTAHAEIQAIRLGGKRVCNYRLVDCSLYVTLEPCSMCCGAIFQARLKNVFYGTNDEKIGACGSVLNLFNFPSLNHQTKLHSGLLKDECAQVLKEFFKQRRMDKKSSVFATNPLNHPS